MTDPAERPRHGIRVLGSFPLVSLAEARGKALDNRRAVQAGRNPLAEKRRAKTPTFALTAARTCDAFRTRWESRKHETD